MLKKTMIMEDYNALAFFQIQPIEFANLEVCKFLKLQCSEELNKLHQQLWLVLLLPSLSKISLSAIVVEPTTSYSILVEDPNLGTFATMHNGPNVCEEKAKKGRISNQFFNFDFMKVKTGNFFSSSTLPKTITIASSTNLRNSNILNIKI